MAIMIRWTLNGLLGELEDKRGQNISLSQLSRETNISYPAIHRMSTNDASRVDTSTLDKLLKYFNRELRREVTAADLLQYLPETAQA